jgi:hypothetical protein
MGLLPRSRVRTSGRGSSLVTQYRQSTMSLLSKERPAFDCLEFLNLGPVRSFLSKTF